MPKQKSARAQHPADSRFGFAKPVFQPPTAALPTAAVIQTKLKVGEPDDKSEQEADRVAELTGNDNGSIPASAAAQSRSAVGSLQRLYSNQAVLQMRNSSGGPPAPSVPLRPSLSGILQRKCACGGSAGMSGECEECSKKQRLGLQTKLKINEPGDIYEREADRVADQVMAAPAHHVVSAAPPRIQRFAGQPAGQAYAAPASVDEALATSGRPLEPALRQDMEQRFGYDFSRVRVHTGRAAQQSAREVNAHAYTVGHHIVFGAGRFASGMHEGRRLIAHELTHVVQQGGLDPAARQVTLSSNAHDAEVQSKEAATYVVPMRGTEGLAPLSTPAVQRQPNPPPPQLTRAEEDRLSFTSPGEVAVVPNPPTLSLYNFAIDHAVLKEKHVAALQVLASLLNQFAGGKLSVTVKGHADSSGEDTINDPLSKNRGLSVQKMLQSAAGVPVTVSSCGEHCPLATNDTVEGRSRNRRVDIDFTSGKKGDDIDWPSLCALVPEICLCLTNPAFCRDEDDDGDGIDWPSLCPGPLGKLICGGVLCILAFKLCLSGLCRMIPELCLATLCKVFPSLCKPKKPSKDEPERKKACPIKVDLPSGNLKAYKTEKVGYVKLWYPFDMNINFDKDSSGCDCACGEYSQLVRGYYKIDETGKGRWKTEESKLSIGVKLDENEFREDGHIASGPYGHRYWDDETRTDPKQNVKGDKFLWTRVTGCRYRGEDVPAYKVAMDYPARIKMHLEFVGGPVDVCMTPGQRIGLQDHWRSWVIDGEAQAKAPPTGPKGPTLRNLPFIIRSGLPKDPKVLQEVTLEIAVQDQPAGCYGKIPVVIILEDALMVTVRTKNSERVQIAPDICPDIWVLPYQTLNIFR